MIGINIFFSARSHTGFLRSSNEDNLFCDGVYMAPEERGVPFSLGGECLAPCVFAVCDGMGGEEDGEFASLAAVMALAAHEGAVKSAGGAAETDAAVQRFVAEANETLCRWMRERSASMGTTLALVAAADGWIRPYNIGDSRIYALRREKFLRVSEEHTLAAQKAAMGILTEEQAKRDRGRHVLTRHIGVFEDEMTLAAAVLDPIPIDDGLRVLLCSDGLTDMVSDGRIEEIVRSSPTADAAVGSLVDEALENGGADNITCVVLEPGARRRRSDHS